VVLPHIQAINFFHLWGHTEAEMTFDQLTMIDIVAKLDEQLRPIAKEIVYINDPNWADKIRNASSPLDQAGVRQEAEATLVSLLQQYRNGEPSFRASIRSLLASHPSFTWATNVPKNATTEEGFRLHLLFLSSIDQSADLRDTIVTLQKLCATAAAAGISTRPLLKDVAELSSNESRCNLGSVRSILLRANNQ
jgi:hypothetical protein